MGDAYAAAAQSTGPRAKRNMDRWLDGGHTDLKSSTLGTLLELEANYMRIHVIMSHAGG